MSPRGPEHSSNWGGVRERSGRKDTRKTGKITVSLPLELIEWIESESSAEPGGRSGLVARALEAYREQRAGPSRGG